MSGLYKNKKIKHQKNHERESFVFSLGREKIETSLSDHSMYNRTNKYTMALKRGTPVTFLGPVGDKLVWDKVQQQMNKKYGISIGDKGKVVRSNAGWTRVTWIRSDGSSAVSVPMRASWLKNHTLE